MFQTDSQDWRLRVARGGKLGKGNRARKGYDRKYTDIDLKSHHETFEKDVTEARNLFKTIVTCAK